MVEYQGFWFTLQWSTLTSRPLQERYPDCVGRAAFQHLEVQEGDTGWGRQRSSQNLPQCSVQGSRGRVKNCGITRVLTETTIHFSAGLYAYPSSDEFTFIRGVLLGAEPTRSPGKRYFPGVRFFQNMHWSPQMFRCCLQRGGANFWGVLLSRVERAFSVNNFSFPSGRNQTSFAYSWFYISVRGLTWLALAKITPVVGCRLFPWFSIFFAVPYSFCVYFLWVSCLSPALHNPLHFFVIFCRSLCVSSCEFPGEPSAWLFLFVSNALLLNNRVSYACVGNLLAVETGLV